MKRSAWSSIFCLCALFGFFARPAAAQEIRLVIDSLRFKENHLVLDFHVDSLLTSHLLYGMQRGLTSSAQFRVQLWRKRRHWFGSILETERQYEIKSTYEPWEQKYVLITAGERRLTSALDLMRRRWEQHHDVALTETKALDHRRRYFVTIELLFEPVSKESLNEIRGWLAGGGGKTAATSDSTAAAAAKGDENIPDRLLNLLINLTGFGKQVITAQTAIFGITESGMMAWEK